MTNTNNNNDNNNGIETTTTTTTSTSSSSNAKQEQPQLQQQQQQWKVRPATLQDANGVNQLLKISYQTLLAKDYDPITLSMVLPKMCTAQEQLLQCGTWYVVVIDEGIDIDIDGMKKEKIVGCGGWTPTSPLGGGSGTSMIPNLRHFATDPNYARQGIGKAIWDQCWNDMVKYFQQQQQQQEKEQNNNQEEETTTTKLYPDTMEVLSTLTAERFYESFGFVKVRDMTIPFPVTVTASAMSSNGDDTTTNDGSFDDATKNTSTTTTTTTTTCDFPCILMQRNIPISTWQTT